ncbi:MAG: BspA family leucine-rich repeat surface protein [Bacteroidota bacterium]
MKPPNQYWLTLPFIFERIPCRVLVFGFFFILADNLNAQSFITTWKTDNPGETNDNQIMIPTTGGGYNYDIDWGDGNMDTNVIGNITHTYTTPGTYSVSISGVFPRIYFNGAGFFGDDTDFEKILTIEQWGNIAWTSMAKAFSGCENLRINATDAPDLSLVTDMSQMFEEASALNDDINSWDVSNVTNMSGLFEEATSFNQPMDLWNVSSVTDMSDMFFQAESFNQDISTWSVENVTTMRFMFGLAEDFNQDIGSWNMTGVMDIHSMFTGCENFNQDISGWDVSTVTDMTSLFNGATVFNQDIGGWNVSNVTRMINTFSRTDAFNQDISGWNIASVTDMRGMFSGARAFNQDITGWNVIGVNNMSDMFANNPVFNQDISGWNVSNVTEMNSMFEGAVAFDQDISAWDVSGVDDIRSMFRGATSFNQNLGGWDVSSVRFMADMLDDSGLSLENYDNVLTGWNALPSLQNNVSFGASGLFYCIGEAARANLISTYGWFIVDEGQGCIAVFDGNDISGPEIINGQAEAVDFGSAAAGLGKSKSFTIANQLVTDITNLNILISGTVFSTSALLPTTLTAGTPLTIDIDLSGSTIGSFTEIVSITGDNFSGAFTFSITGVVTASPEPEIAVYEGITVTGTEILDGQVNPLAFQSEDRGTNSQAEITITNKGSAALTISDIQITGTVFSSVATLPLTIAVGGTETIQLILDGTVSGIFSETLTIVNDDVNEGNFTFDLEGEIIGPEIAVFDGIDIFSDPEIFDGQVTSIDFGTSPQGSDIVRQITIANLNPFDLLISDVSVSGAAFNSTAVTPVIIDAQIDGIISQITFDIVLDGATAGTFNETVSITSDDDDELIFDFPIAGEISLTPEPEIAVFDVTNAIEVLDDQATAVNFGSSVLGADITRQFIIENQGTSALTVSNISLSGSAYSLVSALPPPIAAGGSEIIEVVLSSASVGVFIETLTIDNNDADEGVFNFDLTGEITVVPSPEISVFAGAEIFDGQAGSVDFGTGDQGTDVVQTFTINNIGSATLTISGISLSGSAFSYSGGTPFTVTAGGTNNFDIILSGDVIGTFNETLTITNDDSDEGIFDFPITGTIAAVNMPPTISAIVDMSIDEDGTTGDIPFTINDAESNLDDLVVTASSDNTSLVSVAGIQLGGSGGSRTINVIPEPDVNGSAVITVDVDDGQDVVSESFTLTVTPVNDAPVVNGQDEITTAQNTPVTLELDDFSVTDVDNNFPTGFSLILNTGNNYSVNGSEVIPDDDFVGDLTVPIVINDGTDDSPVFDAIVTVQTGELEVTDGDTGDPFTNGGTISFDDIPVGASDEQELVITNSGSVTLVITEILIDGDDFELISGIPDPIDPAGSTTLLLTFTPSSAGPKTANLTIRSVSAPDFTTTLTASGLSEIPPIEVFNVVTTQQNRKHDFLEIRNIEFYNSNRVFIYSRWGNEVFNTNDYNNTDNRFIGNSDDGSELPDGTYYYVIELNGGETVENGFFLLRR